MRPQPSRRDREGGQVVAIFALALTAIIAMVGLVIDGGSVLVQRRAQQNVADAASLAASYVWLNEGTPANAEAAARDATAVNGYVHGSDGVTVNVSTGIQATGAGAVTVSVTRPHRNLFASIVGMPTWEVSATATAMAGAPNAALGAMPLLFNQDVFPGAYRETTFSEPASGNSDIPLGANQFNWTVYCIASGAGGENCNADSKTVTQLIKFENKRDQEVVVGVDKISPLNAGSHATLFSDMSAHVGSEFPVSIVNNHGVMVGWAYFHLTGSVGGSTKTLTGYFRQPVNVKNIYIASRGGGGNSAFGAFTVRLIN